jgi:hypothetical protein
MLDSGSAFTAAIGDPVAEEMLARGVVFVPCSTTARGSGPDASETRLSTFATIALEGANGAVSLVKMQLVWVVGCKIGGIILGLPVLMTLRCALELADEGNCLVVRGPSRKWNVEFPLSTPAFAGSIPPTIYFQSALSAFSAATAATSSSGGGDS